MASMKKNALTHVLSAAVSFVAVYAVAMSAGCSSGSGSTPATKTTYTGTLYMASEAGGHIAVVPVTIDPSNTTAPISVGTLDKIWLSPGTFGANNKTHVFHDVRLDGTNLYYSAIFPDSTGDYTTPTVHLGYVDLANGNTKHDLVVDAAPAGTGMVYCGSGQTTDYYLPMTMSSPAYIDAIAKTDITSGNPLSSASNVKRTYVEDFRTATTPYLFAHGVNSPDYSKLFVAVNETSDGTMANMTGEVTGYLLKKGDLEQGTVDPTSVTTSRTIGGFTQNAKTIAFRSSFTPDGTKILQAGSDRFIVLDGSNLTLQYTTKSIGGSYAAFTDKGGIENHDAMSTPDGKYAILAIRFQRVNGEQQDSGLQLFDLTNNKPIGDPVSTCNNCHYKFDSGAASIPRHTCGLVGNLK